jgi:hypothetical protein
MLQREISDSYIGHAYWLPWWLQPIAAFFLWAVSEAPPLISLDFQSHMTISPIFLQIFCIILFLAGSITFGTVMAQLSEMLTDLNREKVL